MDHNKSEQSYYLAVRPQLNEFHAVHKDGCPFMPEDGKRIYLGTFGSEREAGIEAKQYFSRSSECRFCSEVHENKRGSAPGGSNINEFTPTMEQLSLQGEQALYYLMN